MYLFQIESITSLRDFLDLINNIPSAKSSGINFFFFGFLSNQYGVMTLIDKQL